MNKKIHFKRLVKTHRKLLLSKGFKPSTLTLWSQGLRFPSMEKAKKLAKVLEISVDIFPVLKKTRE